MPGYNRRNFNDAIAAGEDQRPYKFENNQDKRNVIPTADGWVKRIEPYTDASGNRRVREEILVSLPSLRNHTGGIPTVVDIFEGTHGPQAIEVFLVFSEPITFNERIPATVQLRVTGSGGSTHLLASHPNDDNRISGAGNILRFGDDHSTLTPTQNPWRVANNFTALAVMSAADDSIGANNNISDAIAGQIRINI